MRIRIFRTTRRKGFYRSAHLKLIEKAERTVSEQWRTIQSEGHPGSQNASHSPCSFTFLPFYVSEWDENLRMLALNVTKVQDLGERIIQVRLSKNKTKAFPRILSINSH